MLGDLKSFMMGAKVYEGDGGDGGGAGSGAGDGSGDGSGDGGGNKGDGPPAYMAQLSDDLKTNETLSKHKDISSLARGYLDFKGKSESAVYIPGDGATADEIKSYQKKIGVPEKSDGYVFAMPGDMPADSGFDSDFVKGFARLAHDAGIPKASAESFFNSYIEQVKESIVAGLAEDKKALEDKAALQKESKDKLAADWKNDTKGNVERAHRAFGELGGVDEAKEVMERFQDPDTKAKLGDNPVVLRLFFKLAQMIEDDKIIPGQFGVDGPKLDPQGRKMFKFKET